jgi:hypothetical protein
MSRRTRGRRLAGWGAAVLLAGSGVAHPQSPPAPRSFELLTHRMDVDVDGAPRAYGPPGSHALDRLRNARPKGNPLGHVVGYIVEDQAPHRPVVQGPQDPAPGFYVSQTAFEDERIENQHDPRRYVNAAAINYVVLGAQARRRGARLGDFVAVYSRRTGRSVFGIVGDDGNRTGDEGSLHLLQALGYPFHDGKDDAVEHAEIVIRFFPGSNPQHRFFHTQAALDAAARARGLSRDFAGQPAPPATRPESSSSGDAQ